jgi:hypothetical protein
MGSRVLLVELLKMRMDDEGVEIDTLVEQVDFGGSLSCGRKNALDTLASGVETTGFDEKSVLFLCLISWTKWFTRQLSKSSPSK